MDQKEAKNILGIAGEVEEETLKKAYAHLFVMAFRRKSAAVTMEESAVSDQELLNYNQAYCTLSQSDLIDPAAYQLDFRYLNVPEESAFKDVPVNELLKSSINTLLKDGHHMLILRLLEISISHYLKGKRKKNVVDLITEIRLLGKTMVELGMINQGMPYYNYGLNHFEKAKNFKTVGDYRSALNLFAQELKTKDSDVPLDEICQHISVCYFLMNEYQNAIEVIEQILPEVMPKKQIFESVCTWTSFATVLMVSIYKLDQIQGKKLELLKIRVKYPLSSKYLHNCFGSMQEAFNIIEAFEKDHALYETFLESLKTRAISRANIAMDYTIDEVKEKYFEFFDDSIFKSDIYHPK